MGLSEGSPRVSGKSQGDTETIRIAILDGPVATSHPCFANARLEMLNSKPTLSDRPALDHGTQVASIIFGQPGTDREGIAPHCTGLILPIFGGAGRFCSQLDLARAILRAVVAGAHVINISGGQIGETATADTILIDALAKCESAGVLIVAASGNDGRDCVHVPACIPTVLAVGAADDHGHPLPTNNHGKAYVANGLLAPGLRIKVATADGGIAHASGSSFAAPHVSGVAARLLSAQRLSGERPDPLKVRSQLLKLASPGPSGMRFLSIDASTPILAPTRIRGEMNMEQHRAAGYDAGAASAAGVMPSTTGSVEQEAVGSASIGSAIAAVHSDIADGIVPSDCGCGNSCGCSETAAAQTRSAQFVFALGHLSYDFGTDTRRDSLAQFMGGNNPDDPDALLAYLDGNPEEAERIIWTLELDATPIYAIRPIGAHSDRGFQKLIQTFRLQHSGVPPEKKGDAPGSIPLVAVPGVMMDDVRLLSGQTVPEVALSARGPIAWNLSEAVKSLIAKIEADNPKMSAQEREELEGMRDRLPGFLNDFTALMTRKHRNLGVLDTERALNFATTSAVRVFEVLRAMDSFKLVLDDIQVGPSTACRPGSSCQDVRLTMFEGSDIHAPLHVFQFTVDVNDAMPVGIGTVAYWRERPGR